MIVIQEKYEFPRLYSWTSQAKQSVFSLFNYMENATFRGDLKVTIIINTIIIIIIFCLKLAEPDFEKFSLPSLCSDSQRRAQHEDYCKLSENLPDRVSYPEYWSHDLNTGL